MGKSSAIPYTPKVTISACFRVDPYCVVCELRAVHLAARKAVVLFVQAVDLTREIRFRLAQASGTGDLGAGLLDRRSGFIQGLIERALAPFRVAKAQGITRSLGLAHGGT
jgi:hypothetical protein